MSNIGLGKRRSVSANRSLRTQLDAHFSNIPKTVRAWLAARPEIFDLLMRLEKLVTNGDLSSQDVSRLAKRWSENLPGRRGTIVRLSDFTQTELGLGLPRRRQKQIRPTTIRSRRGVGRKRS